MTKQTNIGWRDYFTMNAWFFGLGFLWNSLHRFIFPAILPILVGVSLQASALSALTTAGLLIAIIVQPISGALSDRSLSRFGRRRPMMVWWTLASMALLAAIAFAPNFAILFVLYCLLQGASNMAHGPAQGLIPDLVPKAQHGAASGVKSFIDNFTLIMAGLFTGNVLLSLSPDLYASARIALLVIAATLFFFLSITVLTTHETPLTRDGLPQESLRASVLNSLSVIGNIREIWQENRAFAWLLVVRLMFLSGIQIVANYMQFYFKDIVLVDDPNAAQRAPQLMGQLLIIVALMLVIVSVPAGLLSDRIGRRAVSVGGTLIGMVAALLLLFVRNTPLLQIAGFALTDLMAVGLLLGIGAGAFFAVNWAWATDLAAHDQAGRYLGISNLATAGAGVLAALGGPLIDWGNAQTMGLGYNIVFVVGALWLGVTLLLLPLVRDARETLRLAPQ
ncbi:MAG: MFS transporter [Chloroflexi bacterium]|nr:MFS transporter [Chloroflexota bacterium]